MPTFEWKGRRGDKVEGGVIVAENKEAVRAKLRRQQIVVTQVKEQGKEIAVPLLRGGVSSKELAIFTRQFSVMIDAGLPLVQCLDILAEQQQNPFFKDVLRQVRQNVEEGSTLFQ